MVLISKKMPKCIKILRLMFMQYPIPALGMPVFDLLEDRVLPKPLVVRMIRDERFGEANVLIYQDANL